MSELSETMGLRPMDAIVTRRCPICGQKMEINEPRDSLVRFEITHEVPIQHIMLRLDDCGR